MITTDITYSDIPSQVEKLKNDGLIIVDQDLAATQLYIYGYSNLIKSYRSPYMELDSSGNKRYKNGTTFTKILSLYQLDDTIRIAVMKSMLSLEEHVKERLASLVSRSFGMHQDDYLNITNYKNRRRNNSMYSLSHTLETIRDRLSDQRGAVPHYLAAHSFVPSWILFKNIYFSTAVSLIRFLYKPQQVELAHELLNKPFTNMSDEQLQMLMIDTLNICLDFRNVAAHGGRIYNFESKKKLREYEIFGSGERFVHCSISDLLTLLHNFIYISPFKTMLDELTKAINTHLCAFPEDKDLLGRLLHLNIEPIEE